MVPQQKVYHQLWPVYIIEWLDGTRVMIIYVCACVQKLAEKEMPELQ